MKTEIGIICSSPRFAEKVSKVVNEMGVQVEIKIGTLEGAIPVGKDLEANGIEVIICRGGTAAILRKNFSIPVLSIPLSTYDLLENIFEASKYGKNIGIDIYGHSLSGVEFLERLFQVRIKQIIYHDSEGLRAGILQAKQEGVDVIIGGNFAFQISQQIGISCVLLISSEESIASAIDEARVVASIRREEKEKTRRMEAILNSVSEGMVAIDKNGIITVFNKVAEDILGIREALNLPIDSVIPQLGLREVLKTGTSQFQSLKKIGEIEIVANIVPIYLGEEVIGAIASLTDVSKVMRAEQKVRRAYTRGFVAKYTIDDLECKSPSMKRVIEQVKQFSLSDSTILLSGESGTGKELVAHSIHSIHKLSQRKEGPFVTVNCSALPDNLLESELFGHEEGAFTGARKGGKMGLFELAHKGTIFLDEIGSISEALQSRLLRVLQQKEVMRIGGDRIIPVDVRIIAATNKDLLRAVKEGRMRMDLYFRLNILRIHIPPLRERKEDMPVLLAKILDSFARKYRRVINPIPGDLLKRFLSYSWPGNIRELENFLERFVLMVEKPEQLEEVLEVLFEECLKSEKVLLGDGYGAASFREESPKEMIFLKPHYNHKRDEIAKMMGISRTTLWRRFKNMKQPAN